MSGITFRPIEIEEYASAVAEVRDLVSNSDDVVLVVKAYPYPSIGVWEKDCLASTVGGFVGYSNWHEAPHIGTPWFACAPTLVQALLSLKGEGFHVDVDPLPAPSELSERDRMHLARALATILREDGDLLSHVEAVTPPDVWLSWMAELSGLGVCPDIHDNCKRPQPVCYYGGVCPYST